MNWCFLRAQRVLLCKDQGAANYNEDTSESLYFKQEMSSFNVPSC